MSFISLKTEGQHMDVWRTSEESCVLTMSFLSLKREGILLSDILWSQELTLSLLSLKKDESFLR